MNEIQQYKLALRRIQNYQRKLSQKRAAFQPVTNEESILTGIIDSLTYSIQYLETGREPCTRRGAHRRSREQREVFMDPNSFQFIRIAVAQKGAETRVSEADRERLEDILSILTPREREAFMLVRGRGLSFEEAASLLQVKKTTVQTLVERAEEKIQKAKRLEQVQRVMFSEIC